MPGPTPDQPRREASPPAAIEWRSPLEPFAAGNQGEVYVADTNLGRVIVKRVNGSGIAAAVRRAMLRREARIYGRLQGLAGVARCHGLTDRGLVLEYVAGESLRVQEPPADLRDAFYQLLLGVIQSLHRVGIAHADLKRRENILVKSSGEPCLIDFGAAFVLPARADKLTRALFRQMCRTDFNAWVKLKYRGDYSRLAPDDRMYYHPTWIEAAARRLRQLWRAVLPGRNGNLP